MRRSRRVRRRATARRALRLCVVLLAGLAAALTASLLYLRFLPPLLTMVQLQRRVEAVVAGRDYQQRWSWVPLDEISVHLQHAVISAEDARFYQHHGLDWTEIRRSVEDSTEKGHVTRGASTITQQLVKNLYLTTHRSVVRKIVEIPLAVLADLLLPKRRILELYLNVAEWGPGVFGAEAGARYHYGQSASRLDRERAARLATCLPAPRTRQPQHMQRYAAIILRRMRRRGW